MYFNSFNAYHHSLAFAKVQVILFHGENRGSIPLGRAKEISSMNTSTPKFQQDLATRLSEIAQGGATPALVTALVVAVRRVVENTKTQETFELTCWFCTWSMQPTLNRNDAIRKLLEGFNDIIVACLQGNFTGMLVPAISK